MGAERVIGFARKFKFAKEVRNNLHKYRALRWLFVQSLYRTEGALLRGRHRTPSQRSSVIHFTVRKAASQYVRRTLNTCARESGLTPVDFDAYSFNSGLQYLGLMPREEFARYAHAFKDKGYCYTPFLGMVPYIENLDALRKVLVVRDPRDVLTSDYFSLAFSHVIPGDPKRAQAFLKDRTWAQSISVYEYARARVDHIAQYYNGYLEHLMGRPNLLITTYEELVTDFPAWLDRVVSFTDMSIGEATRAALLAEAAPAAAPSTSQEAAPAGTPAATPAGTPAGTGAVTKEKVTEKRRQVTPGDHKRKLSGETIAALNETLAPILDAFGYAR
jgi:hypothetical protein